MPPDYTQRRLAFADFLETVPPEHFDMTTAPLNDVAPSACGCTTCVLGWLTVHAADEWQRYIANAPREILAMWVANFPRAYLGLSRANTYELARADAPHQTPQAAAAFIRKFLVSSEVAL